MKHVRMLQDHGGARKDDVVGFEDNAEADAHVAAGRAVALRFDKVEGKFVDVPSKQPDAA